MPMTGYLVDLMTHLQVIVSQVNQTFSVSTLTSGWRTPWP